MKKVLLAFLLIGTSAVQAHGYNEYRGGNGNGWIAPVLIGGVIGYELARPRVYVEPQPNVVYVRPQPNVIYVQPQPEIQPPPYGYHWQQMIDPQTGINKIVAVPN
jgi:hypothetical protein